MSVKIYVTEILYRNGRGGQHRL